MLLVHGSAIAPDRLPGSRASMAPSRLSGPTCLPSTTPPSWRSLPRTTRCGCTPASDGGPSMTTCRGGEAIRVACWYGLAEACQRRVAVTASKRVNSLGAVPGLRDADAAPATRRPHQPPVPGQRDGRPRPGRTARSRATRNWRRGPPGDASGELFALQSTAQQRVTAPSRRRASAGRHQGDDQLSGPDSR